MILKRIALLCAVGICLMVAADQAASQLYYTNTMNYQGRLTDADNDPVPAGPYMITFRIYPSPAGGFEVWSEEVSVQVDSNGLFSVSLGQTNSLRPDMFADSSDTTLGNARPRWLEMQVGSDTILPRTVLGSVPYAHICWRIVGDWFTHRDTQSGRVMALCCSDTFSETLAAKKHEVTPHPGISKDGDDISAEEWLELITKTGPDTLSLLHQVANLVGISSRYQYDGDDRILLSADTSGAGLHIYSSAGTETTWLTDTDSANTQQLYVAGRVGIGTDSAKAQLHVVIILNAVV